MKNRISLATMIMVLGVVTVAFGGVSIDAQTESNLSAAPEAGAQIRGSRMQRAHRRMAARIARHLELSDAQREQIRSIRAAERSALQPLIQQVREIRREMRSVTAQETFDEAQVRALADRQGQVVADLIVARERLKAKLYEVLTPEQQEKLNQIGENVKARILNRLAR